MQKSPSASPEGLVAPRFLNILFGALIVLSIAGVIVAGVLAQHYYQVNGGTAGFQSACNLGEKMNCDVVAASRWSELFWGIPLASLAGGWFLTVLFTSFFLRVREWRATATRFLLWMSIAGALTSLSYVVVMSRVIQTFCAYCLVIDGLVIAILAIALVLSRLGTASTEFGSQIKTLLGIGAGSTFVILLVFSGMNTEPKSEFPISELVQSVLSRPPVAVSTGPELPSIGPADARVTIVKFSDFQCPHCRRGAMMLHTVQNRFPKDVRVVFRNFPLDPSCNPKMKNGGHNAACESARSAYCGNQQGKFKPIYEGLFEDQEKLAPGKPLAMALATPGMNAEQLQTCMASPAANSAISRDLDEGERLGVNATPTFFINGHKVDIALPLDGWYQLIQTFLDRPAT